MALACMRNLCKCNRNFCGLLTACCFTECLRVELLLELRWQLRWLTMGLLYHWLDVVAEAWWNSHLPSGCAAHKIELDERLIFCLHACELMSWKLRWLLKNLWQIQLWPGFLGVSSGQTASVLSLPYNFWSTSKEEGKLVHRCEICGKCFQHRNSLYHHMPIHVGATRCHVCSMVFSRKGNCRRHIRMVHGIDTKSGTTV
jgi:uncharacterized C2H2 Zn-finger protein